MSSQGEIFSLAQRMQMTPRLEQPSWPYRTSPFCIFVEKKGTRRDENYTIAYLQDDVLASYITTLMHKMSHSFHIPEDAPHARSQHPACLPERQRSTLQMRPCNCGLHDRQSRTHARDMSLPCSKWEGLNLDLHDRQGQPRDRKRPYSRYCHRAARSDPLLTNQVWQETCCRYISWFCLQEQPLW